MRTAKQDRQVSNWVTVPLPFNRFRLRRPRRNVVGKGSGQTEGGPFGSASSPAGLVERQSFPTPAKTA